MASRWSTRSSAIPSPAELLAETKKATEQPVDAACARIVAVMREKSAKLDHGRFHINLDASEAKLGRWIRERFTAAGWIVALGEDQREGAWITLQGPSPQRDE